MDFIILKVNGQDLRNATHEQAVRVFRQAKEPILVEVTRRDLDAANHDEALQGKTQESASLSKHVSVAVQTELNAEEATLAAMTAVAITTEGIRNALSLQHNGLRSSETVYSSSTSGLLDIIEIDAEEEDEQENADDQCLPRNIAEEIVRCSSLPMLPSRSTSGKFTDNEIIEEHQQDCLKCPCHETVNEEYDRACLQRSHILNSNQTASHDALEEDENANLVCLTFHEVSIIRRSMHENFGITFHYKRNILDSNLSDVYIGEIASNSLAAEACGIQVGDRVVKINDELVQSQKRVIEIFSDNPNTVKLLVARIDKSEVSTADKTFAFPKRHSHETGCTTSEGLLVDSFGKINICKRTDQDSGLGRTTDDSARTEESSEQDMDSDHKSLGNTFRIAESNSDHTFSENTEPYMTSNVGELCKANLPLSSIDEELIYLGRLMQSLAVHCQQLVETKMNSRSKFLKRRLQTGCSVYKAALAVEDSRKKDMDSAGVTPENMQYLTSMLLPELSLTKGSTNALLAHPRVPPIDMKGLENTSSSGSYAEETSKSLKKNNPGIDHLTKDQDQFYDRNTPVYPENVDKMLDISGQSSAYCTGESVRSQNATSGVRVRLWQLTNQSTTTFGKCDVTDEMSMWNREVTASLSDLGGSILSLAATVSSVPNLFPNNNESIRSSHMLGESPSPVSNWSIDGSSQSNQHYITAPVGTPIGIGSSRNDQPYYSDDSRYGFSRIQTTSEYDSSVINRSRPSGLSNVSSSDNLSVTESITAGPLMTTSVDKLSGHCATKTSENIHTQDMCSPAKTLKSAKQDHECSATTDHGIATNLRNMRTFEQAESRPVCYRPPLNPRGKQRTRSRDTSVPTRKSSTYVAARELPPTPPQQFCSAMVDTALHHQIHGPRIPKEERCVPPSTSSQNIRSANQKNHIPYMAATSFHSPFRTAVPSSTLMSQPTSYKPDPKKEASCKNLNHPYEYYDQLPFEVRRKPQSAVFQGEHRQTPVTSNCNLCQLSPVSTGLKKYGTAENTEDQLLSDIYETPYASVTLDDTKSSNSEGVFSNVFTSSAHTNPRCLSTNIRPEQYISWNSETSSAPLSSIAKGFIEAQRLPVITSSASVTGNHAAFQLPPCCTSGGCCRSSDTSREPFPFPGYPPVPYFTENLNVMEWVIKKRPDGSRYITRRPIRNRLLKARAKRFAEERLILTTDDDIPSGAKARGASTRIDRRKPTEKLVRDHSKRRPSVASHILHVTEHRTQSQLKGENIDNRGQRNKTAV